MRDNATVKELNIPKDKLEQFELLLRNHKIYDNNRNLMIRHYYGHSPCCVCGDIPKYVVSYNVSDEKQVGTRIESYCSDCIKKVYEREQVI